MFPILCGLVALGALVGACLWISHFVHANPNLMPPESHASHARHNPAQSPDDGYGANAR